MAGPILAIAIAISTSFHQSLATLASPNLLDRSTTNEWRSNSPSPRRFCNSSPRNPYYILSGRSISVLAVGVAIYFLALLSLFRNTQEPCVASQKLRKSRECLRCNGKNHSAPSQKGLISSSINSKSLFYITVHTRDKNYFNLETLRYNTFAVQYRSCTKNTLQYCSRANLS